MTVNLLVFLHLSINGDQLLWKELRALWFQLSTDIKAEGHERNKLQESNQLLFRYGRTSSTFLSALFRQTERQLIRRPAAAGGSEKCFHRLDTRGRQENVYQEKFEDAQTHTHTGITLKTNKRKQTLRVLDSRGRAEHSRVPPSIILT